MSIDTLVPPQETVIVDESRSILSPGVPRKDGGTQQRKRISFKLIDEFADDMREGRWHWEQHPLPVVFYDGQNYWLGDGFKRCYAAEKAGLDQIPVELRQGTLQDAIWFSASANREHGQRRSNEDKRQAAITALRHPTARTMSDREIADHVGVSHEFVSRIVAELQQGGEMAERGQRNGRKISVARLTGSPVKQVETWWTHCPDKREKQAFYQRVLALYAAEFGESINNAAEQNH